MARVTRSSGRYPRHAGKTSRLSGQKGGKEATHTVSAFAAARQRLVLGQIKVADKSTGSRLDYADRTRGACALACFVAGSSLVTNVLTKSAIASS